MVVPLESHLSHAAPAVVLVPVALIGALLMVLGAVALLAALGVIAPLAALGVVALLAVLGADNLPVDLLVILGLVFVGPQRCQGS